MTYPVKLTRRRFLQGSVAGSLTLAGVAHHAYGRAATPPRIFAPGEDAMLWSAAFSPDGRTIVSGSSNGNVIFWDVSTGKRLRTAEFRSSLTANSVAFSPDGTTALSGGQAGTLDLCDPATGRHLRTFKDSTVPHLGDHQVSHRGHIHSVAFSPDGRTVLSAADDIKLWDVATGSLIHTFGGRSGDVFSVAFSPDGRSALSGSAEDTFELWDLATGKEIRTVGASSFRVLSVAFSPDGRSTLSGGYNSRHALWDVATGGLIRNFRGHPSPVNSVAFSPDGRTALTSGGGGSGISRPDTVLRLWEVATGKLLRSFDGRPRSTSSINSVAFSPDGRTALSATGGQFWLWDL